MAGLGTFDSGDITVEGERPTTANLNGFRQRLGYVIQEGGLFPHLPGRGNVTLLERYLGWARRRMDKLFGNGRSTVRCRADCAHPWKAPPEHRQACGLRAR